MYYNKASGKLCKSIKLVWKGNLAQAIAIQSEITQVETDKGS